MNRAFIIAGVSALLIAGGATGAALAQAQAPARAAGPSSPPPPPGAGMPGMQGMPGMPGMGMRGMGRDQMGGGRGGQGDRRGFGRNRRGPTVEQLQQRNATLFAELDTNKDGRATLQEFQALQERRRQERQRQVFQRFSGGQDSVTLPQLNARTAERFNQGPGRRAAPGAPPAAPAAPAR